MVLINSRQIVKNLLPLLLSILVYLIFQLPVSNIGINLRDEGFLFNNASLINQGKVPFRDFFLTTTPGSFYFQAILNRIIGPQLITARVAYIILSVLILLLVFSIFKLNYWWKILYLSCLSLIFVLPGGFSFYNQESLLLTLLSLKLFITKNSLPKYFLIGVTTAFCFLFKQSVGTTTFLTFLFLILTKDKKIKEFKPLIYYLSGFSVIFLFFLFYLAKENAIQQFLYYTISFAKSVKNHRSSFILHRLTFIPIFLIFSRLFISATNKSKLKLTAVFFIFEFIYFLASPSRFGRFFSYLQDPIFYFYFLIFMLPLIKLSFEKDINALMLLSLFLAFGASGHDLETVKMTSPFFFPLIISVSNVKKPFSVLAIILIVISTAFLSFSKINPYGKVYGIYPKQQLTANLGLPSTRGVFVFPEEKTELEKIHHYLQTNQLTNNLLCFPYCPMMNFLMQKNNPSYFSFFYFETFMAKNQEEVINDLKIYRPLVIMQKKGLLEPEAEFENERLAMLKNYILNNSNLLFSSDNFEFYQVN